MKPLIASSLAVCLLASSAGAAAGGESFDFLLVDPSVRAAALGGAYTALAADSSALYYNPAGLGRVKAHEAVFMHDQNVQGLTQEYAGLATRQGWALNVNYLNFGGIPRTRLDARDGGVGNAGMSDLALGGGYGRALNESVSVGAGAKLIRETIDEASASGLAVDAGVLAGVASLPGLSLGAALLNAGPGVRFQSRRENLPLLGRAGAAYAFRLSRTDNTAAFDLTKALTDKVRFGFGAETVIDQLVAFRLGFTNRNDAGIGITVGAGFVLNALGVDFAFVPFGDLGNVSRVSVTVRWGSDAKGDSPLAARPASPAAERNAPPAAHEDPPAAHEAPPAAHEAPPAERKDSALTAASTAPEDENLRQVLYNERMGRNEFAECNYAAAKNYFAQAIRIAATAHVKDPAVGDAYNGMGRCLMEEGNVEDASKFFKAAEAGHSAETRLLIEEELETLRAK